MTTTNHEVSDEELRNLFDLYTDPRNEHLINVLSSIQKEEGLGYWVARVHSVIAAMMLHDAGEFPADWFPDDDDLEDYSNDRMTRNP